MIERPARPNRICVDFDSTLTHDPAWNGKTWDLGTPNDAVCDAVNEQSYKHEIVIYTARPKKEWGLVKAWLDNEGVRYNKIKKKKPAMLYVDDLAMRPDEFVIFNRYERTPEA